MHLLYLWNTSSQSSPHVREGKMLLLPVQLTISLLLPRHCKIWGRTKVFFNRWIFGNRHETQSIQVTHDSEWTLMAFQGFFGQDKSVPLLGSPDTISYTVVEALTSHNNNIRNISAWAALKYLNLSNNTSKKRMEILSLTRVGNSYVWFLFSMSIWHLD